MESLSPARLVAASLLAITLAGCGPSDEADRAKAGPINGAFVVSQFFTPSGLMGDGAIPGRLTVDINKNCKVPRPPGAQGDCYRFVYKPGDVHWAGAYWVFPANNWGTVPGRQVIGPVDTGLVDPNNPGSPTLKRYNYVRLSYAIEPLPAEMRLHVWAGKLDGRTATPPQPFYDTMCSLPSMGEPKCLDTNFDPPVPMQFNPSEQETPATGDWQQYRYTSIARYSVQELIAAFGFSTNDNDNRDANGNGLTQVIYLDDIVWE